MHICLIITWLFRPIASHSFEKNILYILDAHISISFREMEKVRHMMNESIIRYADCMWGKWWIRCLSEFNFMGSRKYKGCCWLVQTSSWEQQWCKWCSGTGQQKEAPNIMWHSLTEQCYSPMSNKNKALSASGENDGWNIWVNGVDGVAKI